MLNVFKDFCLTDAEYNELEKHFGDLCKFAAWQLKRNNSRNNVREDVEDFIQDLRIAVMRAGVYYKRQTYIEHCLEVAWKHAKDPFLKHVLEELQELWNNRRKHGANKQRFGGHQEEMLEAIIKTWVPYPARPDPQSALCIDGSFSRYCKMIIWNSQRNLGRKITRERSIRNGQTSLTDFEYLSFKEKY